MAKVELDITAGFYDHPNLPLGAQRCFNLRPYMPVNSGADKQKALEQVDTLELVHDHVGERLRGMILAGDRIVYVVDDKVAEYDRSSIQLETAATTTITTGGYRMVQLATNGEVVAIVDYTNTSGGVVFYDLSTSSFTEVTYGGGDPTFDALVDTCGPPIDVTHIDGFFIYAGSKGMFSGSLVTTNKGRTFSSTLDYQLTNYKDDELRAVYAYRGRVYAMHRYSTQVYQNVGATNFPLIEVKGAAMDVGAISAHGLVEHNGALWFAGQNYASTLSMYRFDGGSISRISTDVIDKQLARDTTDPEDSIVVWAYTLHSNSFVGVNIYEQQLFNQLGKTFVYDIEQSQLFGAPKWHERGNFNQDTGKQMVWCVNQAVTFFTANEQRYAIYTIGLKTPNNPVQVDSALGKISDRADEIFQFNYDATGGIPKFFTTQWVSAGDAALDIHKVSSLINTDDVGAFKATIKQVVLDYSYDGVVFKRGAHFKKEVGDSDTSVTGTEVGGFGYQEYVPFNENQEAYNFGRAKRRMIFRYSNSEFSSSTMATINSYPILTTETKVVGFQTFNMRSWYFQFRPYAVYLEAEAEQNV